MNDIKVFVAFKGTHTVNVRYADIAIKGSPFSVDVFDPMAVGLIGEITPMGRIGKAICVEGWQISLCSSKYHKLIAVRCQIVLHSSSFNTFLSGFYAVLNVQ